MEAKRALEKKKGSFNPLCKTSRDRENNRPSFIYATGGGQKAKGLLVKMQRKETTKNRSKKEWKKTWLRLPRTAGMFIALLLGGLKSNRLNIVSIGPKGTFFFYRHENGLSRNVYTPETSSLFSFFSSLLLLCDVARGGFARSRRHIFGPSDAPLRPATPRLVHPITGQKIQLINSSNSIALGVELLSSRYSRYEMSTVVVYLYPWLYSKSIKESDFIAFCTTGQSNKARYFPRDFCDATRPFYIIITQRALFRFHPYKCVSSCKKNQILLEIKLWFIKCLLPDCLLVLELSVGKKK